MLCYVMFCLQTNKPTARYSWLQGQQNMLHYKPVVLLPSGSTDVSAAVPEDYRAVVRHLNSSSALHSKKSTFSILLLMLLFP